jgi:flagella basal body P-ring formation protein FlgA
MIILATIAVLQASGAIPPATLEEMSENPSFAVALSAPGSGHASNDSEKERTERAPPQDSFLAATPKKPIARASMLVLRNRPVRIEFVRGALLITAEGRALSNGKEGDMVRILNTSSRSVVLGVVVGVDRVAVR